MVRSPNSNTRDCTRGLFLDRRAFLKSYDPSRDDADGDKVETEAESKGTAWRDVPPGLKDGEKQGVRSGRTLTVRPKVEGEKESPRGPEPPKTPILPVPPVKQ